MVASLAHRAAKLGVKASRDHNPNFCGCHSGSIMHEREWLWKYAVLVTGFPCPGFAAVPEGGGSVEMLRVPAPLSRWVLSMGLT